MISEIKDIPKGWEIGKLEDFLDYLQPTEFIVESTEYSDTYKIPVLTAGKSFIKGYTNETTGVFNNLPVIIFDDFTTANKFVNFPFKVKSSAMKILKPKAEISNIKFVFYFMQTLKISTDTHKRYWISVFSKLKIPVPPLLEQQAIVAKIEELLSELDNGKQQLQTAQQQLKVYRQSLLKWAFEGKLTNRNVKEGELPDGWRNIRIGDVIESISSGKSYRCNERPPNLGEVGIIKVSSVTWGFFDEMQSKTCFSNDLFNSKYQIHKGDFLFSRANTLDFIGACVIVSAVSKSLMLSDKILRFTFSNEILKEYALYYLRSKKGRLQIEALSTGNQDSMRNIGQEKIKQIQMPLPPISEQQLIVDELESKLTLCDKVEETIKLTLQQAETLQQSILKKAFEGKLV
jgi:type I restriction enzyme S subunit